MPAKTLPAFNPRQRLRDAQMRVTAPRLAVLEVLAQVAPHQNAEAIAAAVRARLGTLSTQAVYDNLHALVEAGIARRIEPAGSAALYELRVGDNHHHLICRLCGQVQDVDCVVGEAPCLHAGSTPGFKVDEAEVTFWGTCSRCRKKRS
jgi:Fur family ferric uptake transcriptional regulator